MSDYCTFYFELDYMKYMSDMSGRNDMRWKELNSSSLRMKAYNGAQDVIIYHFRVDIVPDWRMSHLLLNTGIFI